MVLTIEQMWIKIWIVEFLEREKRSSALLHSCVGGKRGERERWGLRGESLCWKSLSLPSLFSLHRKTSNKHTCSPDQSPQHCPNFPCLRRTLTCSHSSLHTNTHKTHKCTHTHTCAHAVPFLITHSESRAVRDRGEWTGAVLWCNGRKCWCFIWNWWSLVSAALPGAGPLCAGCVNERSNWDWTRGAESQSIELLESHTETQL